LRNAQLKTFNARSREHSPQALHIMAHADTDHPHEAVAAQRPQQSISREFLSKDKKMAKVHFSPDNCSDNRENQEL
jgi:hypothetical protein